MNPDTSTMAAATRLCEELLNELTSMDDNPPDILYHYTDSRGLLGILDTKQLWFSQAGFLNDSSEVTYAGQMIKSALNHRLASTSSRVSFELLTRTLQSVDVFSKYNAGAFMACFCEDGDLLSQWRGYGSLGGGFSLGFEAKQLKNRLKKYSGINEGSGFFKVIYDEDRQRGFVSGVVERFCQLVEDWEKAGWDPIGNNLVGHAHTCLERTLEDPYFKFKHAGFAEEQEWRLIITRKLDHQSLKFRSAGARIVPFFEIDMGTAPSSGPSLLPLTRVVCGPTQSQEISKKAIEMRLGKEYPKGSVEITSSSVPLRV